MMKLFPLLCQKKQCVVLFLGFLLNGVAVAEHGFWSKQDLIDRKLHAEHVRISAALHEAVQTDVDLQKTNGDLERYKDKRGSFSKGLAHKSNGMVKHASFESMIKALKSGESKDFEKIILGGTRHLSNPQGAYAYALEGADAAAHDIPTCPRITSAQAASEMVELYWASLLRDVPFNQYTTNSTAMDAIADLNTMSDFRGPKQGGVVTAQTLLRGSLTSGDLVGPYISQFFYQPIPYNGKPTAQLYFAYLTGTANNFLTDVTDLLLVQNGGSTGQMLVFQGSPNYLFTGRDIGTFVHNDYSSETFVQAALILLGYGTAALDKNNPYKDNLTQDGFVTYGAPKVIELVNIACAAALKATWYEKWMVHLRLRPEFFGFLVQDQIVNGADFDLHKDLINSPVLGDIFGLYGTYLLPQMYPEGSPTHPSYPAAHASIAGACVTILKAFFDEKFVIPHPVQPNVSNTGFDPYVGTLYVGDELNKLASNVALARSFAGVHYRSDDMEGMRLGEKIALSVLMEEGYTNNESFKGFKLTLFNGEKVVVGKKIVV
jgi:membrane-associated phospholipid phosphatase